MSDNHTNHNHSHATPKNFGKIFVIAILLNIGIVLLEIIYGLIANSTALIADALHNSSDVLGLILAWGAFTLAQKLPSQRFTYGLRSSTVLASVLNGLLIMGATGAITWEAIRRFTEPVPVEGGVVMFVAAVAIFFNAFSAWLLSRGHKNDINIRGAFWHLVSDALVSVGVVASAFFILKTGATWLDPITSLLIATFILYSTWGLMKEALYLSLNAVPTSVDAKKVQTYLKSISGVQDVHDIHIWPISTTDTALTAHFVVNDTFESKTLLSVSEELEHRFQIGHSTIQIESVTDTPCKLAPDAVV